MPEKKKTLKKGKSVDTQVKGTNSKHQKKTKKNIVIVGKVCSFNGLMILKGGVIDLATFEMFRIKEFLEKLEHQKWSH